MLTRAALLLCVCAVAEGAKKKGFQKVPQFYTTSDCTGGVDPESKQWSMEAEDGVAVRPFENSELYLQPWVFDKCLTGSLAYSVEIAIDETACENNNTANQIVLNYYTGSNCSTTPTVVLLTANKCVPYAGGSVKLVTEISLQDLCTMTEFVTKMRTGGTKLETWLDPSCEGTPLASVENKMDEIECGAQPECEGCCQAYDACKPQDLYAFNLQACKRSGDTWRYSLKVRAFTDMACTEEVKTVSKIIVPTECTDLKFGGKTYASTRTTFVSPMTLDLHCRALEVGVKYNIDPSIVSWSELNAGAGAVPRILALVAVVFAALL